MDHSGSNVGPGCSCPLGAAWDGAGVNFALFGKHAIGVELCLFDGAEPGSPRGPRGA